MGEYERTFRIGPEELAKIDPWLDSIFEKRMGWCREQLGADFDRLTNGGTRLYAGAIGGDLTYMFVPNSIGLVTMVRCNLTGEELDLTDYDEW